MRRRLALAGLAVLAAAGCAATPPGPAAPASTRVSAPACPLSIEFPAPPAIPASIGRPAGETRWEYRRDTVGLFAFCRCFDALASTVLTDPRIDQVLNSVIERERGRFELADRAITAGPLGRELNTTGFMKIGDSGDEATVKLRLIATGRCVFLAGTGTHGRAEEAQAAAFLQSIQTALPPAR